MTKSAQSLLQSVSVGQVLEQGLADPGDVFVQQLYRQVDVPGTARREDLAVLVIGAFLGARYLQESDARRRIWAAAAMAVGVIALALG